MMYSRLTVNPVSAAWNTVAGSMNTPPPSVRSTGSPTTASRSSNSTSFGSDLQLVERVTGRLTKARAAAVGALSGMWVGLLIGILFGLFTTGHAWLAMVAAGIGLGVLWGADLRVRRPPRDPRRA